MIDTDLQRAHAGDVKKINKRDDLMIFKQAHSTSFHSYLFYWLNSPPLMVSDFLTSAIEHILNADLLRAIDGNNLTLDHCFDIADIWGECPSSFSLMYKK